MGNPKYGEFTFSAPKARPTVAGYAHGGKVAMKKGGESKVSVKSAKLVGMKMEPEAMVKKEVALLKKAGAPAKLIKHEEREGALMGLKKGGKPKGYQEGGSAESGMASGSSHTFREVNGKYMHNNEEVSKADFDRRKAAVDTRIQRMRGPDTSKMSPRERSKSAFDELDAEIQKKPYKKGGMAGYAEGGAPMTDRERMIMESKDGQDSVVYRKNPFDRKTVDMPGDFQGNTKKTELGERIAKGGNKTDPMFRFKKFSEDANDLIKEKKEGRYYKKGGKVGYAEGGNAQSDKELAAKEDARADKALRDQQKGYKDHYKREEAENRADRKAAQDALMYIPRKIGEGAKAAYDAVMGKKKGGEVHSDVAMDKKVIKKAVHKHEAAMHPGKPMTKLKKGGNVQKYADGGVTNYIAAPGAPGGMPTKSAPNAPSPISQLAQSYAAQKPATPGTGGMMSPSRFPPPRSGQQTGRPLASSLAAGFGGALANVRAPMVSAPTNRAVPAYAQGAAPAMKKGGSAKKGVPTFNRTPKC